MRRGTGRSDRDHGGLMPGCGGVPGLFGHMEPRSPTSLPGTPSVGGCIRFASHPRRDASYRGGACSPGWGAKGCLERRRSACSVGPALTDQPPVADPTRRSSSGRVEDAARRRATTRWRIAIAVAVVALLAIGGFLLFGGDEPLIDGPSGPGEFSFDLTGVKASATSKTPPAELKDAVREASTGVKETMDELYLRAFVDTDSWGDYASAYELFDGAAAVRAERDSEVLTLGTDASDGLRSPDPDDRHALGGGPDRPEGCPDDAPSRRSSSWRTVRSRTARPPRSPAPGPSSCDQVDGTWKIYAYRVDRDDEDAAAPSPSGSPS